MSEITPGPWRVNGDEDVWIGDRICIWVGDEDDARLISSAPDLLSALEDCVKVMESELYGLAVIQPELAAAKAALEQAKGQQ